MDTGIIIALIGVFGNLVLNLLQLRKTKAEAKKLDTESSGVMIELALKLNRQEIETLRTVCNDLKEELEYKDKIILSLETRIKELETKN